MVPLVSPGAFGGAPSVCVATATTSSSSGPEGKYHTGPPLCNHPTVLPLSEEHMTQIDQLTRLILFPPILVWSNFVERRHYEVQHSPTPIPPESPTPGTPLRPAP